MDTKNGDVKDTEKQMSDKWWPHCQLWQREIPLSPSKQHCGLARGPEPITMLPAARFKCILTASLQMIQKPDVTGFLITF